MPTFPNSQDGTPDSRQSRSTNAVHGEVRNSAEGTRAKLRRIRHQISVIEAEQLKLKTELTREEAAIYLGIALSTLDNWHQTPGKAPPKFRRYGKVFYLRKELDLFKRSVDRKIES